MHLMVDLETLGTDPRAVILSIGAVRFTETEIVSKLYLELDIQDQLDHGTRKISPQTLAWWVDQGDDAKRVFSDGPHKHSLAVGLYDLGLFIGSDQDTVNVWSNGAAFDVPILETAYNDVQGGIPWRFYNVRCYRTVKAMYPGVPKPQIGTAHNALDDALSQALHLQAIWQQVR
jgi:DNA polymerase III epsilon subunit-like protein